VGYLSCCWMRSAPAPTRWHAFLSQLWGDDVESIETLQELFGYLVSGDTKLQKMFLVVGPRRSGKGTIARVLRAMLGVHNVAGPTLAGIATNFGLSPLRNEVVNVDIRPQTYTERFKILARDDQKRYGAFGWAGAIGEHS